MAAIPFWLFVNSWGGIRMNPAPFFDQSYFYGLFYCMLFLGTPNKPPYPDHFFYDVQ